MKNLNTKERTIEIHRLTISGLPQGLSYGVFLENIGKRFPAFVDREWKGSGKSHAMKAISFKNGFLWMQYYSYIQGYRPDVIDTQSHNISPSPYSQTQAGVEYTHVLGATVGKRYLLLVEKVQAGIWPETLEGYLQWMIDKYLESEGSSEKITLSIEADPSEEFISRMETLDRITRVTIRTVRPNPGWADLETELARESEDSDAHKTEVTMVARKNKTLSKTKGIVVDIQSLFKNGLLSFAQIEGWKGNNRDHFSTKKLNKKQKVKIEADEDGKIKEESLLEKMTEIMKLQNRSIRSEEHQ